MAAIYTKALKRQDYSGTVDKDKVKKAANKKAGIKPVENLTSDDPKAGADSMEVSYVCPLLSSN
jgi:hypothetical protein